MVGTNLCISLEAAMKALLTANFIRPVAAASGSNKSFAFGSNGEKLHENLLGAYRKYHRKALAPPPACHSGEKNSFLFRLKDSDVSVTLDHTPSILETNTVLKVLSHRLTKNIVVISIKTGKKKYFTKYPCFNISNLGF